MQEVPLPRWEGVDGETLAARWGVPAVHLFETLGSSNDVARRMADGGAPAGTVVLAERQAAGRGRAGRAWSSPPGLGLWFSMLLRPRSGGEVGAVPLLVGATLAAALDPFVAPARVGVKWPNDLLVEGRKLGGILCEGVWERSSLRFLVAGVGLNLLHAETDFPPELRDQATSVGLASTRRPDRLTLATAVIGALSRFRSGPLELDAASLAELEQRDALRGREVLVTEPTTGSLLARGTGMGIAPDGSLLVRTSTGVLRRVHSGTVRTTDGRRG